MSDRDIRQHQCIEKWVHNKCKGCIEGCTGFGAPRGTIGYILKKILILLEVMEQNSIILMNIFL